MVAHSFLKSPDEWATTKQACRDELVVYLSFSSHNIHSYIHTHTHTHAHTHTHTHAHTRTHTGRGRVSYVLKKYSIVCSFIFDGIGKVKLGF